MFGSVAVSGEPAKFEIYFKPLKTWFEISVICPEKGFHNLVNAWIALRLKNQNLKIIIQIFD